MTAIGYMISVCAAAAGLGVAISMWFRRRLLAISIAMLVWLLPIVPWLAVAMEAPALDLGTGPYTRMPEATIESLDRAFISAGRGHSWMNLWSIVFIASAASLLLAAHARLERMANTNENILLVRRSVRPQLISGHGQ
jgi:hypothetical protein